MYNYIVASKSQKYFQLNSILIGRDNYKLRDCRNIILEEIVSILYRNGLNNIEKVDNHSSSIAEYKFNGQVIIKTNVMNDKLNLLITQPKEELKGGRKKSIKMKRLFVLCNFSTPNKLRESKQNIFPKINVNNIIEAINSLSQNYTDVEFKENDIKDKNKYVAGLKKSVNMYYKDTLRCHHKGRYNLEINSLSETQVKLVYSLVTTLIGDDRENNI